MGFGEKIKGFFKKLKEENKGFGATMKRINNAQDFCGNVNRRVKNGDFWNGSYLSIEAGHGVIYGSNQADYCFTAADVASFSVGGKATASLGNQTLPATTCILTFKDGLTAEADILNTKLELCKASFSPLPEEE